MFNYVSIDDFETLRQRWMKELAEGCPSIDKRIVKTVKRFNTLPGVVSIWSCSGHTKDEYEANNEMKFYNERQERYIIFAANPAAANVFKGFAQYLNDMDRSDWALVRPELITAHLGWAFDINPATGKVIYTMRTYPCWTLQVSYNNLADKDGDAEMARLIHESMEEIWEGMIDYLINYCEKEPVCQ